jgi:large subunit ribosomal protein L25
MHPWKQIILHIDFQRVDETTKLHKKVPLHFVNEENSVAVKTDKCLVNHVQTELEVECLAAQLPEFITIDLGHLVKGQSMHVTDLKLPDGIKAVRHGSLNPVIVSANPPRVEEEAAAPAAVVAPAAAPAKAKKSEKQNKK